MNADGGSFSAFVRLVATALVPIAAATLPARIATMSVAESLLRLIKIDGLADSFEQIRHNIVEGERLKIATAQEDLLAKQVQRSKTMIDATKSASETKLELSGAGDEYAEALDEVIRTMTKIGVVRGGKILLDEQTLEKLIAPPPASVLLLPESAVSTGHVGEALFAADTADATLVSAEQQAPVVSPAQGVAYESLQEIGAPRMAEEVGNSMSRSSAHGEGVAAPTDSIAAAPGTG